MQPTPQPTPNTAEIAKEAFLRLAKQRIAPTPDNYRDVFNEISGIASESSAEVILADFAKHLIAMKGDMANMGVLLVEDVTKRNWSGYTKKLQALALRAATPAPPAVVAPPAIVERPVAPATPADTSIHIRMLRDMLVRTLGYAIPPLLQNAPELVLLAETLGQQTREAVSEEELKDVATKLKKLCFKLEIKAGDMTEQHELLLQLFRLLIGNVSELVDQDSWLHGQIATVRNVIDGPISHLALKDAIATLKEVVFKQGVLKQSLTDAKHKIREMMSTFSDRMGAAAISTGDYYQKIDSYNKRISLTQDIRELNVILEEVMQATHLAQADALRSRDDVQVARDEMQQATDRIQALEQQLEKMSELVREDQLTGSLNRRGLDDAFEREAARGDRTSSTLCIALLDLDDFKKLNDNYGHIAGDEALKHLVLIVKDTLRSMDVVGRFGGEEFLIILPDTTIDDAAQTVTRVQRELTKRIFMVNDERLLVTFSAGVAARLPNEDQPSLIHRADLALYEAKKAGKNRVAKAP